MSKASRMNRPNRAIVSTELHDGVRVDFLDCGHSVERMPVPRITEPTHRRCKECGRTEAATTNETTGAV